MASNDGGSMFGDKEKMAQELTVSLDKISKLRADSAIINAKVLTMNPHQPEAAAVAIKGGRIVGVGSIEEIEQCCGPITQKIDLKGKTLLPGFIEPHNHMAIYASRIKQVDCRIDNNKSIKDILERIKEKAESQPEGTWIEGYGYDDTLLEEKRHITRQDLDSVAPDHLVTISHASGHLGVANSKTLELAGINRSTPSPEGGDIFKDEDGEPTGVLAETALFSLGNLRPKAGMDEVIEGLGIANLEYLKAGITSINCGGSFGFNQLVAYQQAQQQGILSVRVYADVFTDFLDVAEESGNLKLCSGLGDDWFKIGGAKILQDGSIQGFTAATIEPYYTKSSGSTDNGLLIYSQEELNAKVLKYHRAGYQVQIHGNGDRGIESIIKAFEHAQKVCPREDTRHHIIHCQMAHDNHLDKMAELGVAANFFPDHIHHWGDRHRDIFIGPERAARMDPMKSAVERDVLFGLHTDAPVRPVNPILCIHSAVNRETSSGQILGPEQRTNLQQALEAVTINGAKMIFEEHTRGTIEKNKMADLVVLSDDPFSVDPMQLKNLKVEMTMVDGKVVYDGK